MKKDEIDSFYKIIVYGDEKVGKTQLINVFNGLKFEEKHYPTFGVDFKVNKFKFQCNNIELQIIDTAGDTNSSIDFSKKFIKRTDAFIIVFDLSRIETLDKLDNFLDKINIDKEKQPDKIIYLVGNKYDLNCTETNDQKIYDKLNKHQIKFAKVSAKLNYNLDELFINIIDDIKVKKNFFFESEEKTETKGSSLNLNNINYFNKFHDNKTIRNTKNYDIQSRTFSNKFTSADTFTEDKLNDSKNVLEISYNTNIQQAEIKKKKCCPIF